MKANLPKGFAVTINGVDVTLADKTVIEVAVESVDALAEALSLIGVLEFNKNLESVEAVDGQKVKTFYGFGGKKVVQVIEK